EDFAALQFNTAIAQLMIFVNEAYKSEQLYLPYLEGFLKMLACITPFIGEEIWYLLGHKELIVFAPWPSYDEEKLIKQTVTMAVSVNGKLRATFEAGVDDEEETVKKVALSLEGVVRNIQGKQIVKIIVVKGRIVNIVVR
ncbi:MAG: class I tRNA ligase family protein, partial [Bacilli bacterium]|nr:class I tRNA ligase family protein [Bacilli bacterium]